MIFSSKKIFKGTVPTAITAIYTVADTDTIVVKNIFVSNTDETNISKFSLFVSKAGETVDTTKAVISNLQYTASQKENINDLFLVLEPGDIISVSQTAVNALNIYISGVLQQ